MALARTQKKSNDDDKREEKREQSFVKNDNSVDKSGQFNNFFFQGLEYRWDTLI